MNYDIFLLTVDYLIKMVYYEPIKIILDIIGLVEVITNVIIKYHILPK